MYKNIAEITELMATFDFPKEAVENIICYLSRMMKNDEFLGFVEHFEASPDDLNEILDEIMDFAERKGESWQELNMCLFLLSCESLRRRYSENGLPDELFIGTMTDLKYKLIECRECYGPWGIDSSHWYRGFYNLTRFGLGRLQFEKTDFGFERFEKCGAVISRGETAINIHIPSSGPLTKESRMDAYRRAYKFFGGHDFEPMAFVCHSWLLYPENRDFLTENRNILDFMDDFDIIESETKDEFGDNWRVFGMDCELPPEQLPQKTSLQRAFAQRLIAGKPTGSGYGVFFFDGERILGK